MIIAGAGSHAVELLGILDEAGFLGEIFFFDDIDPEQEWVFGMYTVLHKLEQAEQYFRNDALFAIGVGKPANRKAMADKLKSVGGKPVSIISPHAFIGKHEVRLGEGLNIMTGAVITQRITIGNGSLIHVHCSIHHDVVIGEYCELSPGCRILGKATIGSFVSIGSGAVIFPQVHIGDHAVIGAGAVVNNDVAPGITVAGSPAKPIGNERRDQ